jgi:hypothetical protein
MMRCVPTSSTTVSLEYEVYRHVDASDYDFNYIDSFFKRVLSEDKGLCTATQKNLNAGVFVSGEFHPELESAPIFFQGLVRKLVTRHREDEQAEGREIWPSRRQPSGSASTEKDAAFCSSLSCDSPALIACEW